jgi:hypothetical protein
MRHHHYAIQGLVKMTRHINFAVLLIALLTAGCAFDGGGVFYRETQFDSREEIRRTFVLKEPVVVSKGPCKNKLTLRQDTAWDFMGTIPEGRVYSRRGEALTIKCDTTYETHLVVRGGYLVGFYLSAKEGFVRLKKAIELPKEWTSM